MKANYLFLILLFVFYTETKAQNLFFADTSITITVNGNPLPNGLAGGLNFPIFSEIDLNSDGIKDLFAIDRSGNINTRITTFINQGTANAVDYKYAPYYRQFFPDLFDWALLVDYNCDGKEDIFTYTPGGMKVYKNDYNSASGLKFLKVTDLLHSTYYSPPPVNLWVSPVNLPAFADIDNDGDMDILTFGLGGFQVEYHINKSMDLYGHCDSLIFELGTACWGHFTLNSFSNSATLGVSCPFKPVAPPEEIVSKNNLHGGSSILAIDLDNDTVKDMVMGDLLGNNLLALFNGGTLSFAEMNDQDTMYPPSFPTNITTYPVPMYLDVDNDGIKDLIVSPHNLNNFNGIWFYKNNGINTLPDFQFVQNAFLQDQMIDLGEGCYPVFFDYDGDGLMDIVAGNYGYFDPSANYPSSLHLYKNTGTATSPAFELITTDFANTLSLGLNGLNPSFGDLDGDGDKDMILGDYDGKLHLFTNIAGVGNPASFVLTTPNLNNFDVGQFSAPQIIDVNKDSKPDLIVGRRNGRLSYFENTGSTSTPSFTLITDSLGRVDVRTIFSVTGHSIPFLYEENGNTKLLVGAESGYLYKYDNIDGNLNGTFNLVDSMYQNIYEGNRISQHGADITGDGQFDLVIGNYSGGFTIYTQSNISSIEENHSSQMQFNVYPNPANDKLTIAFALPLTESMSFNIINNLGQIVKNNVLQNQYSTIDISTLPAGMYFFKIYSPKSQQIQKLVITR